MFHFQGHETTATTLGWSVKHLANNPLVQSRLREALREALHLTIPDTAIHAFPPSVTDILSTDIPYLDATIEEMNRHANTVPLLVRVATVDTDILGYKVPKGATVMCNAQFMTEPQEVKEEVRSKSGRDAQEKRGRGFQMRDLEAFMPERWLVKDETGREVFDGGALTRLAFSLGPRGCFGMFCNTPLPCSAACLFVRFHFASDAIFCPPRLQCLLYRSIVGPA